MMEMLVESLDTLSGILEYKGASSLPVYFEVCSALIAARKSDQWSKDSGSLLRAMLRKDQPILQRCYIACVILAGDHVLREIAMQNLWMMMREGKEDTIFGEGSNDEVSQVVAFFIIRMIERVPTELPVFLDTMITCIVSSIGSFDSERILTSERVNSIHFLSQLLIFAEDETAESLKINVVSNLRLLRIRLLALVAEHASIRMPIIKSLFSQIYSLISHSAPNLEEESIVEGFQTCRLFFHEGDIDSFATLMCIILESSTNKAAKLGGSNDYDFWEMVLTCMNSSSMVTRKRGAYIFQKFIASFETEIGERGEGRNRSAEIAPKELRSSWGLTFLCCYNQVEGATQLHLVMQVWPILRSMLDSLIVISSDESHEIEVKAPSSSSGRLLCYPQLTFNWFKIPLNILLQNTIPIIRKSVMYKIFT